MKRLLTSLPWIALALGLAACSADEAQEQAEAAPATPVTVVPAQTGEALVTEQTVGRIEAQTAPEIAAEVPGAVERIAVEIGDRVEKGQTLAELESTDLALALRQARAEVERLSALASNQEKTVERYRELRRTETLSVGMLEEAESQWIALKEQLDSAQSALANARRNLERATIRAPISGRVQARYISPGDYLRVNDPAFVIAADEKLRIHLPFPESVADRIRPGQIARLTTPSAPETVLEQPIASIRPVLTSGSRALEALLFADNPGGWLPGASVSAEVSVARREEAVLVPEVSVVRRPAGTVVFVLKDDGTVSQVLVTTGVKRGGQVEILSGLRGGEKVVADGAGFLTDGARVQVREPS
jgi:RND family efflux transporter MFP subunit